MTAEKLDSISNACNLLQMYDTCNYEVIGGLNGLNCSRKLKNYYLVRKNTNVPFLDRLCKKHYNLAIKEKEFKEIIELSNKDILYLKITGKL